MPKRNPSTRKPQDDSPRGRLTEDQARDKAVYLYLLNNLTDLGTAAANSKEKPNESSIAKQWGLEDNRIFVRRVLRSVLGERYSGEEEPTVPGLTLGKLVKILSSLERYWAEKKSETPSDRVPRIITRSEKLRALREFSQLSMEEREELDLPLRRENVLLQQLAERITDPVLGLDHAEIVRLYKTCLSQSSQSARQNLNLPEERAINQDKLIQETIEDSLKERFKGLDTEQKSIKIENFKSKIDREISRIEFQAGLNQLESLLGKEAASQYRVNYLTADFIKHLTQSIIENDIVTDEFPIALESFAIEKTEPLPLYVQRQERETTFEPRIGLLNPQLLENEEEEENINGLEKQVAYKISVNFSVKLGSLDVSPIPGTQTTESGEEPILEFCEEIRGIGSPVSHITAAINRFLLFDIPSLKNKYLPTACELIKKSELISGDNHCLVWSHNLVELCDKEEVETAIRKNQFYYDISQNRDVAFGEYYGFDLLEVGAKSILMARLKAIARTGVKPQQYLSELCFRIREQRAFKKAKTRIDSYPFSLKAMEGELYKTLLKHYYHRNQKFDFIENHPQQAWSWMAYQAHLTIAEGYLKEGLYRVAKKYLEPVERHIDKFGKGIFDEFFLVRYSICQARYNYLTDLEDDETLFPDRYKAIRAVLENLNEAENYLQQYLRRCYAVDELTQSNFNPFFYFLSRIYTHRAKIYIFHSPYAELFGDRWEALLKPIQLLEQARIYAARDGKSTRYAQWTAYQSWCYLIVAYLADYDCETHPGFSKQDCIDWAKKLLNRALLSAAPDGKLCYQAIKDRGGCVGTVESEYLTAATADLYEIYGDSKIQIVPLIQELQEPERQDYDRENHILHLDVSILKPTIEGVKIYLFGTHSCLLMFAMGMLELCEEQQDEAKLRSQIQTAIRLFAYCWGIAEDGCIRDNPEEKKIERNFKNKGDGLVRSLYPHRLTQFADLGKMFEAAARMILLPTEASEKDWQPILELTGQLLKNSCSQSGNVLGQKRYNGHLAEHYKKFQQYVDRVKQEQKQYGNLLEARDRIVAEVFKILRG